MPALAVLPLLGSAALTTSGNPWLAALKVVALLGGAVFAGRYLLRPVLRTVALTNSRAAVRAVLRGRRYGGQSRARAQCA